MIEFNWELRQVLSGIKKGLINQQATKFLRPYVAVWGDEPDSFNQIAESIFIQLPSEEIRN